MPVTFREARANLRQPSGDLPARERPARETTGVPRSRGWRILREQWRDFLQRQPAPGRILADITSPDRPERGGMSHDTATRALERIISQITDASPRSAQKLKVWKRSEQMHGEVYAALKKQGWPPPHREKRAGQPPHEKVFPSPWLAACTEETVAELALDAFMSDFADALIDGAVVLAEATQERTSTPGGRGLGHSSSAQTLEQPRTRGWSRPSIGGASPSAAGAGSTGRDGFTMAGLPEDEWDAWNRRKFHACSNSQTYLQRVTKATDAQRPRRRVSCSLGRSDQRKYVWPMTATNFPEEWEQVTSPPRPGSKSRGGPAKLAASKSAASKSAASKSAASKSAAHDEESREDRHSRYMTFDRHNRTLFPYSLVSHRAFLESQTDPVLKAKAEKLAPLRMTNPW